MRQYECMAIVEAEQYAADGGQALHLHRIIVNWERAPKCFKAAVNRGEHIAHLFDNDTDRLRRTARKLGVKVVYLDREGRPGQHLDLCGAPLKKAIAMCRDEVMVMTLEVIFRNEPEDEWAIHYSVPAGTETADKMKAQVERIKANNIGRGADPLYDWREVWAVEVRDMLPPWISEVGPDGKLPERIDLRLSPHAQEGPQDALGREHSSGGTPAPAPVLTLSEATWGALKADRQDGRTTREAKARWARYTRSRVLPT